MEKSSKVFVGMDVHKELIDIAAAEQGGEPRRASTRCFSRDVERRGSPAPFPC